ncbi:MAG: FtsX-like permease family protein [bacterium]|nr:FtsX-like permease family protein [bacterium]
MFEIVHDLHSCVRSLRRQPFTTLVAVSILALGLAGSVAVVTYVNGFYQPFPGVDADRLVQLYGVEEDEPYTAISFPDYLDYAAASKRAFAGDLAAAQQFFAASVRHPTMTEVIFGQAVSGNYFSVLDVDMRLGRGFLSSDDRREAPPAVVLSHSYWRRRFGGDEEVVGRTLYLNGKPFTMVGVAAPEFLGSTAGLRPDIWLPFEVFRLTYTTTSAVAEDRDRPLVLVYGRLRRGLRVQQAQAELEGLAAGLDQTYPRSQGKTRRLRLAAATWVDPDSRLAEMPTAHLMLAAGGVLLLLACANVANLLLSVAAGRRREMALRATLGASPRRLLRQILTENLVLAVAAGGLALLLAGPAASRLGSYFAHPSVWGDEAPRAATIDLRVFAFTLAVSIVVGLVAGALPALRASRRNLVTALKASGEASPDGPGRRLWGRRLPGARDLLVSAQVALSVVLLVVAGLVLRTLDHAAHLDPGFAVDQLVASIITVSSKKGLESEDRPGYYRELVDRLAAEPWVRAATVADSAPFGYFGSRELRFEGHDEPAGLTLAKVVPGYFETVGLEVLQGRSFLATDTAESPGVALVNASLARRFFADQEPVGRRLWWPGEDGQADRSFEIVGVVRDTRSRDFLAEPEPLVYFSYPQHYYRPGNALLVATTIDPAATLPMLERWLREFDPEIALLNALPYTEVIRGALHTQRMNAALFSVVALLGLALAAAGIFSVMSLAVSRRTREIGIRMAVGAQPSNIARLVIVRALGAVGLGLGLGLAVAWAVTRLVRSLLYGVEATDPLTFTAGTAVLVAAAGLATYLPTRRAVAVDPSTSLRCE